MGHSPAPPEPNLNGTGNDACPKIIDRLSHQGEALEQHEDIESRQQSTITLQKAQSLTQVLLNTGDALPP